MLTWRHKRIVEALADAAGPVNPAILGTDDRVAEAYESLEDVRRALVDLIDTGYVKGCVFEHRGDRWVYAYEAVEERAGEARRPSSAHPFVL